MRTYLNGTWRAQLPEDLDAVIVPVDKLTNNEGETKSAASVTFDIRFSLAALRRWACGANRVTCISVKKIAIDLLETFLTPRDRFTNSIAMRAWTPLEIMPFS